MSDEPRFCVDCRWIKGDSAASDCGHEVAKSIDYVTGKDYYMACAAMRILKCGPEGKLWEPRT